MVMNMPLLFVAVVATVVVCAQQAFAAQCPATIEAAQFTFPQKYGTGAPEDYDWLISLTAASANTPPGDTPCAAPVYVGQYQAGKAAAACITTAPTATETADGCQYKISQTDGGTARVFDMTVTCDDTAATLQPPSEFIVTDGPKTATVTTYIYTATFKSKAVCAGGPGPNPPPPTTPTNTSGLTYEKEACSGGCAFLIVFFAGSAIYVVAAVVFNIVKGGKRGLEAAPHTDFWSEIPSLIKDGVMFLFRVITCRASAGAGYQQV